MIANFTIILIQHQLGHLLKMLRQLISHLPKLLQKLRMLLNLRMLHFLKLLQKLRLSFHQVHQHQVHLPAKIGMHREREVIY